MFELSDFRDDFLQLNITNEDDMLLILDYFNSIAEIGYESFMNNTKK